MNEESWMRGQQTYTLLQYISTCEQYARTSEHKGATGSRTQSIYLPIVPTQPMM